MKTWKRIASTLLAMVMVLGLGMTALAANDGSVTIDNATEGQTYTIYKVFDLTYSGDSPNQNVSYTYTKTGDSDALYSALSGDNSLFTLTASVTENVYNVSLKKNSSDEDPSGEDVAAFLKGLVEAGTLTTTIESIKATNTTVTFNGLAYGYYYVKTTLGTSVTVNSTMKDVTIKDKNEKPETDKKVEEDSTKQLGDTNTADIGDVVNFTTTISAKTGAENYVLHDTMTEGLTFDSTSVKVTVGESTLTAGTDYTLVTSPTDSCTFEISFAKTYLDSITESTTITVTYSATVNSNAVIDGDGNTNKTHLSYGENSDISTTEKTTTTYVFDVDILKYTGTEKTPLSGAEFVLYKTVDGTNYYAKITDGKLTGWTKNSSSDCKEDSSDTTYATTLTSGTDGTISVDGMDADTYYLEETTAPDGYNLLDAPVEFKIDDEGNVSVKSGDTYQTATNGQIDVENNTGSVLPSTGGIGTTIFYVVGGILIVGAGIILISRRRMGHAEE